MVAIYNVLLDVLADRDYHRRQKYYDVIANLENLKEELVDKVLEYFNKDFIKLELIVPEKEVKEVLIDRIALWLAINTGLKIPVWAKEGIKLKDTPILEYLKKKKLDIKFILFKYPDFINLQFCAINQYYGIYTTTQIVYMFNKYLEEFWHYRTPIEDLYKKLVETFVHDMDTFFTGLAMDIKFLTPTAGHNIRVLRDRLRHKIFNIVKFFEWQTDEERKFYDKYTVNASKHWKETFKIMLDLSKNLPFVEIEIVPIDVLIRISYKYKLSFDTLFKLFAKEPNKLKEIIIKYFDTLIEETKIKGIILYLLEPVPKVRMESHLEGKIFFDYTAKYIYDDMLYSEQKIKELQEKIAKTPMCNSFKFLAIPKDHYLAQYFLELFKRTDRIKDPAVDVIQTRNATIYLLYNKFYNVCRWLIDWGDVVWLPFYLGGS